MQAASQCPPAAFRYEVFHNNNMISRYTYYLDFEKVPVFLSYNKFCSGILLYSDHFYTTWFLNPGYSRLYRIVDPLRGSFMHHFVSHPLHGWLFMFRHYVAPSPIHLLTTNRQNLIPSFPYISPEGAGLQ